MAVNVNLVGNVGKDPETRNFPSGGSVTSFTVGVSQGYFDKRNQWQDQGTMWLEVEPITQGAKSQLQYVHKGDKVHVSGLLSQRFFTPESFNVSANAVAAAPPEDPWSQPPTDFGNEPDPEF